MLHEALLQPAEDWLEVARRSREITRGRSDVPSCVLIREGSEATEAMVLASLPGATSADKRTALRELEEFIHAAKAALPLFTDTEVAVASEAPP